MAWNSTLTNLRDALADLYPTVPDSRRVVVDANLRPAFIEFDNKAINNWHNILSEADKRGKVDDIVIVASNEYPENVWLNSAKMGSLTAVRGADIDRLAWHSEPDDAHLEKLTGAKSTLLPISFLEIGLLKARSVVRIALPDGSSGSGFLTNDNLIITNNHVIASQDQARRAKVQFNYQLTPNNLAAPLEELEFDPDNGFATSPKDQHDWAAIRVQGNPAGRWGGLSLKPTAVQKDEWVNIIQHPGGGPKQIALYHNVVTYADATRVQYLTDTLPGSSGSPVFNSDWEVVALHHSGGWLKAGNNTKEKLLRNEGIAINAVIEGLKAANLIEGG